MTDFRSPAGIVADGLTPLERAVIVRECIALNPNLRGAEAADLLDMSYGVDACLDWTEPYWEAHTGTTEPGWYGMAVHAAALLVHRIPTEAEVTDLVVRCSVVRV